MGSLRECVKLILERIHSKSFDTTEFKKIRDVNKALAYARSRLKPLGKGSSRAVFLFSSRYALKIAMSDAGVAQNEAEVDVYTNPASRPIVAKVQSYGPGFTWIVSELVRPLSNRAEFRRLTGMQFGDFAAALDADAAGSTAFEDDLRGEQTEMVEATAATMEANDLVLADVNRVEHWGKTADGRVVLLDYGFTTSVAEKHYWNEDSENESEYSEDWEDVDWADEEGEEVD